MSDGSTSALIAGRVVRRIEAALWLVDQALAALPPPGRRSMAQILAAERLGELAERVDDLHLLADEATRLLFEDGGNAAPGGDG